MLRKRFLGGQSKGFLYPDLALMGGLAPALQRVLNEVAGDPNRTKCDRNAADAGITEGPHHSTVSAVADERNFHINLWYQGVLHGSGWTSDLREIARAAVAFHRDKFSVSEIAAQFEWFKPSQNVASHQRGAEIFVPRDSWRDATSSGNYLHSRLGSCAILRRSLYSAFCSLTASAPEE
jgi:hypothetical protein